MIRYLKSFDLWLHKHLIILLLLLLMVTLRVPNFFEPYWYGDEAIYLTIGNGIRDGQKLYTEIVDHKTPLIYYLATTPNQFGFRLLLLGWMTVTTIAFYHLAKKLVPDPIGQVVASILFVILTTIPHFEGNIPNGELFVMGFVLVGGWIISRTTLFQTFLEKKHAIDTDHDVPYMALAGFLFGLAILTKVPAVLDLGAFLFLCWLTMTNRFSVWRKAVVTTAAFTVGALVPILLSIVYFAALASGKDYLDYGLLYNFRYAESWGLSLPSVLLEKLFTLPGKTMVMAYVLITLTVRKNWFSRPFQFVAGWLVMALFASLLSNRPYPHYFMQLVPPLALLIGLAINHLEHFKSKYVIDLLMGAAVLALFHGSTTLLKFQPYGTLDYYGRFVEMMTGRKSPDQYRQSFNHLIADNTKASKIIRESGTNEIFIWGTNALLYAQSGTYPVGKYTVSFHIKDFNAEDETMTKIKEARPLFIVTMHDEEPLPGLNAFLADNYMMNNSFTYFTLWKRVDSVSTLQLL